jgi:16S rRNA (cytidine1402-2'-O)-methyltransferase
VTCINLTCGTLTLIATPIGHPDDITLRALEVLRKTTSILCEDTRVTNRLLDYHGINGKSLYRYDDHTGCAERARYLSWLHQGQNLVLVSDAGTPTIADPGYKLVQQALEEQIPILALPGPCAAIMALTLSGLPTNRFVFEGFLAPKSAARRHQLSRYGDFLGTIITYEVTRRLYQALDDIDAVLGPRSLALARELTKPFEEVVRGSSDVIRRYYQQDGTLKGECVLLIGAPLVVDVNLESLETIMTETLQPLMEQVSIKDAVSAAYDLHHGRISKKILYAHALHLKSIGSDQAF